MAEGETGGPEGGGGVRHDMSAGNDARGTHSTGLSRF